MTSSFLMPAKGSRNGSASRRGIRKSDARTEPPAVLNATSPEVASATGFPRSISRMRRFSDFRNAPE